MGKLRGAAEARYDVAGLGNAIVDALVVMEDRPFLAAAGFTRGHMTPVDHGRWHAVFREIEPNGVTIASGGSCANTIATLGHLGARARFCGQVGEDQFGALYAAEMDKACGGHSLRWTRAANTGKCLAIVSKDDAERTMLTDLGASVTMDDLGPFSEDVRSARVLHAEGYLLLGEPLASRLGEAVAIAAQEEILVSIDASDPFVVHQTKARFWAMLEELVDIVFLNAEEATALTGKAPEHAAAVVGEHVRTAVVKLGARGATVCHDGKVISVGAHPVQALDTTGAGDNFAAGFLYGLTHGLSIRQCADLGARVAALCVAQVGAVVKDRAALAAAVAAARAGGAA